METENLYGDILYGLFILIVDLDFEFFSLILPIIFKISDQPPLFLCNGTNPLAACAGFFFPLPVTSLGEKEILDSFLFIQITFLLGSIVETYPSSFPANSTVTIQVEFLVCIFFLNSSNIYLKNNLISPF